MSMASGNTGSGFSRLDWILLGLVALFLSPFVFTALRAWAEFLGEFLWQSS